MNAAFRTIRACHDDVISRVAPPADLRPLVETFAGRTAITPRMMFPVFPTARAELIFHFGDPFLAGDDARTMRPLAPVTLLGPRMKNYWQSAGPRIDWFLIQLTPLGCERLLNLRFGDAWEQAIAFDGSRLGELRECLQMAATFDARLDLAIEALRALFSPATDDVGSRAGSMVRAGRIRSIENLCACLDVGPRRLHQRFVSAYGVGPKLFLELMRFGRQLAFRHPSGDARTHEPEYADDSHAIREFRRFSGMTPGAYTRMKSGGDRLVHTGAPIVLPN